MDSFHWNSYFLTGLSLVDKQHHHLVDLINTFGELLADNQLTDDALAELFDELQQYALYHFSEEEKLMVESEIDPQHVELHKAIHSNFVHELNQLYAEATEEPDSSKQVLLDFLVNWLAFHILGEDKNLASQINAINNGKTPAEAFAEFQLSRDKSKEPLIDALHYLFDLVSERNRRLKQLNEHLEELVNARTGELRATNQQLGAANEKLEEIAFIDALTGLPNRRRTMIHINELWDQQGEAACLMIDADYFKAVNDNFGHDQGDHVLRQLSMCLKHTLRNDDFVGRLGGDEFLVICATDLLGARQMAEKIKRAVNKLSVKVGGAGDETGSWEGSVSIGYASRTSDQSIASELIALADKGVYLAKDDGRNCFRSAQEEPNDGQS